jgi:hypothetical protein
MSQVFVRLVMSTPAPAVGSYPRGPPPAERLAGACSSRRHDAHRIWPLQLHEEVLADLGLSLFQRARRDRTTMVGSRELADLAQTHSDVELKSTDAPHR